MPDEASHLAAYERHLVSYADTLEKHPDWSAVMLFYCAVHLVEQFFSLENKHFCEHVQRELEIKSNYSSFWPDYRLLKAESMKTRYLADGIFSMTPAQVEKKLRFRLGRIKEDIESRITARKIPGL